MWIVYFTKKKKDQLFNNNKIECTKGNLKNFNKIQKIISHCLLILEELPVSVFTKKPKNMFENLQHMIACSTFYLTDVLKRFDRKVLSNFFNSIGRKLLGMDESSNNEPVVEEAESEETEAKQKKMKKQDEKAPTVRQNEIRALENQLAKSNVSTKNAFFSMLTGNEDMAQIYSFIVNNPTKIAYKELIKFRRRNNYFEMLVGLLQKALNEELTQDIAEWSLEIIDWLQKRNGSIIGNAAVPKRKPDGFVAKIFASDIVSEMNDTATASIAPAKNKIKPKRKIKKYKLLIPIDLDLNEKIKLEEKQKTAIDLLYDQLPDLYEKWCRRKKFRKILQEESAFKSQFFSINALSNFSQMMNRVNLNSSKNYPFEKVNSISYLDPQNFLFDRANVIIMNFEELPLIKQESLTVKQKKSEPKVNRAHASPSKVSKISHSLSDEKAEIKDTAELIADILNGIESQVSGEETTRSTTDSDSSKRSKFSIGEFVDLSSNIFDRFKIAVVVLTLIVIKFFPISNASIPYFYLLLLANPIPIFLTTMTSEHNWQLDGIVNFGTKNKNKNLKMK
ncbi:cilia- and flagella-associated 54 [Brachionus plicatilis]|uniref:Cilia-and flagella-associated 54 n=1 Tax=Brachionus plicatilis TaxID=10195 RepID=A0A3M7PQT8_BRAPC|nr:cilia- and flagella-associated 54 [Brachionus plicatilis]